MHEVSVASPITAILNSHIQLIYAIWADIMSISNMIITFIVMVTMSQQSGFENWHKYGLRFLSLLQK